MQKALQCLNPPDTSPPPARLGPTMFAALQRDPVSAIPLGSFRRRGHAHAAREACCSGSDGSDSVSLVPTCYIRKAKHCLPEGSTEVRSIKPGRWYSQIPGEIRGVEQWHRMQSRAVAGRGGRGTNIPGQDVIYLRRARSSVLEPVPEPALARSTFVVAPLFLSPVLEPVLARSTFIVAQVFPLPFLVTIRVEKYPVGSLRFNPATAFNNSAKLEEKKEKNKPYFEAGKARWERSTVDITAPLFDIDFSRGACNGERIQKSPNHTIDPSLLEANKDRTRLRVHNPHFDVKNYRNGPRLLFTRFPKIVTPRANIQICRLIRMVRATLPAKRPPPKLGHDKNRKRAGQDHPASHYGTWQPSCKVPKITGNYRHLRPRTKKALDRALVAIRKHILDPLARVIEAECPDIADIMLKVRCYILSFRDIRLQFLRNPALNFGRMFTTMAISEHGSVQYHIDWNDDRRINAQVIPLGGFKRGYVCFPQLGQKFALRSGDAGGMASRDLVHRSEVGFGNRECYTVFLMFLVVVLCQRLNLFYQLNYHNQIGKCSDRSAIDQTQSLSRLDIVKCLLCVAFKFCYSLAEMSPVLRSQSRAEERAAALLSNTVQSRSPLEDAPLPELNNSTANDSDLSGEPPSVTDDNQSSESPKKSHEDVDQDTHGHVPNAQELVSQLFTLLDSKPANVVYTHLYAEMDLETLIEVLKVQGVVVGAVDEDYVNGLIASAPSGSAIANNPAEGAHAATPQRIIADPSQLCNKSAESHTVSPHAVLYFGFSIGEITGSCVEVVSGTSLLARQPVPHRIADVFISKPSHCLELP
ncbi:hypothetical protein K474DRAFT_1679933 [Panus rudis PR-1116 ss-1]|nr:hypothetical protein K474DRAFT_1679933 [Panus rudis PR-1116 ss-1]